LPSGARDVVHHIAIPDINERGWREAESRGRGPIGGMNTGRSGRRTRSFQHFDGVVLLQARVTKSVGREHAELPFPLGKSGPQAPL
jgi:hypothetical protein